MQFDVMQSVLGLVRHALTTYGGYLVASGMVSQSEFDMAVGAVVTLAGVVWSVIQKRVA